MSGESNIGGYETKVLLYIRKAMAGESQGALSEIAAARTARDKAIEDLEAAEARLSEAEGTLNGAGGRIAEIDAELASRGIDAEKLLLIDRQMDEVLGAYIAPGTGVAGTAPSSAPSPRQAAEHEEQDQERPGEEALEQEELDQTSAEYGASEGDGNPEADAEPSTLRSADHGWPAERDAQTLEDEPAEAAREGLPATPAHEVGSVDDSDQSLIQATLAMRKRAITIDPGQASLEEKVPTRGEARENVAAFFRKSDLPENVTREVMDADEVRRQMPSKRNEAHDADEHWGSARSLAGRRGGNGDI